jgi:acyl-coenzyme A thioesterase PaaI-like protein
MGAPSAFTGELTVRFEAPAPLEVPLEFRGRLVESKGRRQFLEGEASGPDGRFASAKAIFINMAPEHLGVD